MMSNNMLFRLGKPALNRGNDTSNQELERAERDLTVIDMN